MNKKRLVKSFILVFFIFGVSLPLFIGTHRHIKADTINDLTNTTWQLNNSVSFDTSGYSKDYYINFTSNNVNCDRFIFTNQDEESDYFYIYYKSTSNQYINVYYGTWQSNTLSVTNASYQQITITGGNDATNSTLINWFNNNATQIQLGTQLTYHYWSPDGIITMNDNDVYNDNSIEYTILYNQYNNNYENTQQTGLIFKGKTTNDAHSYIESINGNGINLLYMGDTNNIDNSMWLEFTVGDTMNTDLYNFMSLYGTWFNDANAYLCGTNQGYVEGTAHGRALGQADGTQYTGLITSIFNGLGGLLSIQVFPNITIALLIGLPLLLGVLVIILKILRS